MKIGITIMIGICANFAIVAYAPDEQPDLQKLKNSLRPYVRRDDIAYFKNNLAQIITRKNQKIVEIGLSVHKDRSGLALFNLEARLVSFYITNQNGICISGEWPLHLKICAFEYAIQNWNTTNP